mgnify:CR=1 FL=1
MPKLLELNEGFVANTKNYNSNKGACKREYSISKGKLYIHETIKKSANNYELSWIATDEEVHRIFAEIFVEIIYGEIRIGNLKSVMLIEIM